MSDESQGGASDALFFDGQETLPESFHCLILQTAIRFDATQVFPRPSEPILVYFLIVAETEFRNTFRRLGMGVCRPNGPFNIDYKRETKTRVKLI